MTQNETLLDQFAAVALQSLISKMPLLDEKGEIGKQLTPDELQDIRKEIAASAYNYASWMLVARKNSLKWLEENKGQL